jgi:hypothetical protein
MVINPAIKHKMSVRAKLVEAPVGMPFDRLRANGILIAGLKISMPAGRITAILFFILYNLQRGSS